jgi:hypothetical protein
MTDNPTPTTVRWEDPDGSWWIISWDPDRGRYDATKFTHDDAGEDRIVDDVGFGDRRITTVEELAAQMNRTLPPEVVHDLEHPASVPTQLAMTPVVEATERAMGRRLVGAGLGQAARHLLRHPLPRRRRELRQWPQRNRHHRRARPGHRPGDPARDQPRARRGRHRPPIHVDAPVSPHRSNGRDHPRPL